MKLKDGLCLIPRDGLVDLQKIFQLVDVIHFVDKCYKRFNSDCFCLFTHFWESTKYDSIQG
jgi:hypothetical protein